ncbi:AAA family ATPase [archaeon]|nr:AAA family ATPase [archaeon]
MNITLSGLPGTGTTTVGNLVSEKLNMEFISTGELFRKFAKKRNMTLAEFGKLCEENPAIDKLIDSKQKELSKTNDNAIFEGRLSGHMCNAQLKIWLFAPQTVRALRVAKREDMNVDVVLKKMIFREKSEAKRYMSYYNIDINDTSLYDLVIDSSKATAEEIAVQIIDKIKQL